jgi:hypothetical protein
MRFVIAALFAMSTAAAAQPIIVAPDGTYLGRLSSNQYDPDSVSNPYGRYGNPYSADSINNPYGKYGSRYSNQSPNNPYAQRAPSLFQSNPYSGGNNLYQRRN